MLPEAMTYVCPFCDHEVQVGKPCPGCAKKRPPKRKPSEKRQDSPEGEDFDYEAFVAREFGKAPHQALGIKWYWWLLAILLLILLGWGALMAR